MAGMNLPHMRLNMGRLLRTASLWEDALKILTTTNTTWAGTRRMCERLVAHFGAGAFPRAEHLADVTIETLREKCGLDYRAYYAHALAGCLGKHSARLRRAKKTALLCQGRYKFLYGLKRGDDYVATLFVTYAVGLL
jgi:3-methyladenine DNA glycosylase/8-oxoguanine DNA glycosylase